MEVCGSLSSRSDSSSLWPAVTVTSVCRPTFAWLDFKSGPYTVPAPFHFWPPASSLFMLIGICLNVPCASSEWKVSTKIRDGADTWHLIAKYNVFVLGLFVSLFLFVHWPNLCLLDLFLMFAWLLVYLSACLFVRFNLLVQAISQNSMTSSWCSSRGAQWFLITVFNPSI